MTKEIAVPALMLSVFLLAGASSAQGASPGAVTLYGVIDIGMEYLNNAGRSGGGLLRMHSGGTSTSNIGFKGSEDLGGGMQSFFQLESGFQADTGERSDPHSFFNRQANVGLSGAYGKVLAGRSESTTGDFSVNDPIMGNNYSWSGASTHMRGDRRDGTLGRISNLVKYEGSFGSYRIGGSYGLGEAAGSHTSDARYSAGLQYLGSSVTGVLTFDRENSNRIFPGYDRASNIQVSGSYAQPLVKFFAGYRRHAKHAATASKDLRSDFVWIGASYPLSQATTVSAAIYHVDLRNDPRGNNGNPTMYAGRIRYAMSARTSLYLVGAYAVVKNSQPVAVSHSARTHAENGVQVGINMGVTHRF
ncbi:hypothetical protein F506_15165 [Herbaspirillum hiltneri N3]|uniref:Porin domain-containing protein n=1 Tax=Herbaspirillum hiltneri N3 TaxID=1262470 RepID=A0ABM5V2X4_9BURK|nr:porin [Herbaspirillum hiltneri]AKZ63825.1 hypothetical protein F506_15165 [Herbaspirillum hiltneri N3]